MEVSKEAQQYYNSAHMELLHSLWYVGGDLESWMIKNVMHRGVMEEYPYADALLPDIDKWVLAHGSPYLIDFWFQDADLIIG